MRPFDLEAAKRGEPIVTRDGRPAKFVAHVPEADDREVVCLVDGELILFGKCGSFLDKKIQDRMDLLMAPPPMRSINGHKYPEPVREPLKAGQEYSLADPSCSGLQHRMNWDGVALEFEWLKRGLIHLTPEAAEAHARAIVLAGGGEV